LQKTIVFDFDGTLADTLSLGINIFNSYSSKFGYKKISLEQNKNVSAHELISMAGIKLWKLPFLVRRMRKDLNENISQIQIFKGIPDLLESLKSSGFKMGILSSNSKKTIYSVLKNKGLESYFSFINGGVSIFGKNRTLISLKRKIKNDIIYVGDELRDIEACKGSNTAIASVSWGINSFEVLEKANHDYVAKSPIELLKILCSLADSPRQ